MRSLNALIYSLVDIIYEKIYTLRKTSNYSQFLGQHRHSFKNSFGDIIKINCSPNVRRERYVGAMYLSSKGKQQTFYLCRDNVANQTYTKTVQHLNDMFPCSMKYKTTARIFI